VAGLLGKVQNHPFAVFGSGNRFCQSGQLLVVTQPC
jgi:hypothetical protein